MLTKSNPRHCLSFVLIALLVLAGCSGEEPVSPANTGIIQIHSDAAASPASWVLSGPESYRAAGEGAEVLKDMAPGIYTIVWTEIAGWTASVSESQELTANGELEFGGAFAPLGGGTVVINGEPDKLDFPWQLMGPKGLNLSGQGDIKMVDMVAGEYWLSWGPVEGWEAPLGYAQNLAAGETITFEGVYFELPPHPALPFAGTEDQLMANFRDVYEEMNALLFPELLHRDFLMLLQESTVLEFPDVGPTLDLNEELRIADRMFNREPVTDPDGNLVHAISGISFPVFERLGTWEDSFSNGPFPQTRTALYDVSIRFDRPGASTLRVDGRMQFYVAGRDSIHNGTERIFYEMMGQADLTGEYSKAVETISFGSVKALYR